MPAASHPIPSPDRNAPERVASTTFRTLRVSVLTAQSTSLRESLGWSNQRGSKTSQACYSHPRCNPNLVRLFRFSLLLPLIGRIFSSLTHAAINLQPPSCRLLYHAPGSSAAVLQSPVTPNSRRSSATQSVHSFSFPPGPRFPRSRALPR